MAGHCTRDGRLLAFPVVEGDGTLIVLSMLIAALFGLLVPTALHAVSANPRIAALAAADMATLLVYFGLAAALLG